MPDSQTETQTASSAVESQTDVKPATESSTAESSTVTDVPKKSMLEAVKAALKPGSETSSSSEITPETTEGTVAKVAGAEDDADDGDLTPEEAKQLTRNVQRRFHVLTAKRKQAEEEVKTLRPMAESFEKISTLMQRNNLDQSEVDGGFEIMALIKSSPEKALERLAPIVKKLLAATGHQLPDDLKAKVEAGALSEADARELSTARSRAAHLTTKAETDAETRATEEDQRKTAAVIDVATKTADAWHAERAKTDPDWHLKQQRVLDGVKLNILETKKFPQNEKEARALFDSVLKSVETEMKRFLPKKTAITPTNGSASPDAKAEPTSFLEAVKQAARRK